MNQFLYSRNFKLNLTLPRRVKSFLSLKPCLARRHTLYRSHARTHTHSYDLGVLMFWIDGTAHSEDNRIRCKHSGQNQCLGLMSTTIFTKCNYQPCFISKARRCSPLNSDKSLKHKHYWLHFRLRTPSQTQYTSPLSLHWFHLSQVNTLVGKRNTDFQKWESRVDEVGGRGRRPSSSDKWSNRKVKKNRHQARSRFANQSN